MRISEVFVDPDHEMLDELRDADLAAQAYAAVLQIDKISNDFKLQVHKTKIRPYEVEELLDRFAYYRHHLTDDATGELSQIQRFVNDVIRWLQT